MTSVQVDERTGAVRSRGAEGFPEEAFQHLGALEGHHFWFRSRSRLIVWALERYFPDAARLLEVGCGTGLVLEAIRNRFPATELVGADLSREALLIAGNRVPDSELLQLDAREISFRNEFDVVCALDVLEHIEDDLDVLNRLAAGVRRGGGVLITVPQYEWLWSGADDYGGHRRRYTKREIDEKIGRAGFELLRSTAWVCTLLPFVAVSRFRDRHGGNDYDPRRELRPPRTVNRLFELVLDAEGIAIQRGLTLPFGTSRLVVARKP
jgi:2-polyprenyl-3-methyl-5-hydroxy-6-metoxy-1,4-benzoquinol methylase